VLDVLIAAWLTAATVRELPGEPPVVLAVGKTVPATGGWPDLARTVACRAFAGEVLTYLLVWPPGESESPVPVAFYREKASTGVLREDRIVDLWPHHRAMPSEPERARRSHRRSPGHMGAPRSSSSEFSAYSRSVLGLDRPQTRASPPVPASAGASKVSAPTEDRPATATIRSITLCGPRARIGRSGRAILGIRRRAVAI
jgi:hypothetical protein